MTDTNEELGAVRELLKLQTERSRELETRLATHEEAAAKVHSELFTLRANQAGEAQKLADCETVKKHLHNATQDLRRTNSEEQARTKMLNDLIVTLFRVALDYEVTR